MMSNMEKKNVLVTGASSGIGWAIAEHFASNGHRVVAAARRNELVNKLSKTHPNQIHPITLDVKDLDAVISTLSRLPDDYHQIDILVNNAGMGRGGDSFYDGNPADWQEMIDTNITGAMNILHAILPQMVQRKSGQVINMGSIAASYAYPTSNVYGATKAFLRRLSLNLRTDLIGTNVRVTDIEPGVVETAFTATRLSGDQETAEKLYNSFKALQPQDIARVVDFVASTPEHVNIDTIEVMPTEQAAAGFILGTKAYSG